MGERIVEPVSKPDEKYDPDYHDPFLLDIPEAPVEPEVEVVNNTPEPADVPKGPFGVEVRTPFAELFPGLPEPPEMKDPFSEIPGLPGPDGEPDIPGPGGRVR